MKKTEEKYKRIIIKIGTNTITYPNGTLNLRLIERLSWVLTDLHNQGRDVVLVSSGAIGVGSVQLGFSERPTETRKKQAAAAVGQAVLMQTYQRFFNVYGQKTAQILLTKDDVRDKERRQNTVNTFETLLELGVIPIVNANDTVTTFEAEFSDNDKLSAYVAALLNADLLILLTDIDALYDKDPKTHPDAKRIPVVNEITDETMSMAGAKGSSFSVGGMKAKLSAAKICFSGNTDMIIASGDDPARIFELVSGEGVGTLFTKKKGLN